jgi:hypothetical protein
MKALDLAVEELPRDVPAGTSAQPVSFSARRADALALVAESFLAQGAIETAGAERYQIVVHVAAETLRDRIAGCCEFEHGPSNTRYIDAHHVEHWANGGETKPSNLVSLCRFHHRAVHEPPSTASRPASRSRLAIGRNCRPEPW